MSEIKQIITRTSIRTVSPDSVFIKTEYEKDELPNILSTFISSIVSTQDGVPYIEGELPVQMKNYPDHIDCYIDGNGNLIIQLDTGDEDNYSINSSGNLIWED
jgi:hypothetical protein